MTSVASALPLALALIATHASPAPAGQPAPDALIRAEFRVFDRTREVTAETRLRVRTTGAAEPGRLLEGRPLALDLEPGLYDVQAIRQVDGRVVAVRWAERLVVARYPDEEGRHLQAINFSPRYGALQLRTPGVPKPPPDTVSVGRASVDADGAREPALQTAETFSGDGYLLVIAPAGVYDIRVDLPGQAAHALGPTEIPADRTRMKVLTHAAHP